MVCDLRPTTYQDILLVLGLGGGNDSGGNHELFPGLSDVHVMNTVLVALVDVALHLLGAVLGANVDLNNMLRGRN